MITAGCDDDAVSPVESLAPAPPTALIATTLNQSTIKLDWTHSATAMDSIATYVLSISDRTDTILVSKLTNSYNVAGLSAATNYIFSLSTRGRNGKMSTATTVQGRTAGDTILAPAPPTYLMAASRDYQTVALKWMASASAEQANFAHYELTITPAGGNPLPIFIIAKNQTAYEVKGLTEGIVYTFALKAKTTEVTNNLSTEAVIQWSPATRIANVRLYETASNQFGAGYNFKTERVLTLKDGTEWDIALDTRSVNGQASFDLGSPSLTSYSFPGPVRNTLISTKMYQNVNSIDDVYDTDALGTSAGLPPTEPRLVNFTNATSGFVLFVKTADGNMAKVFVKANNGRVLQGTAPNRYIEMDIS
ncbi:MAG TPA: fibronectin type III domain-containing protein, partial [Patescibacteria group bacterium]|nr:fibronectin type III domain-containing protein [Patescibacteria group bacterium]